ncbi:MAG: hypothetical protein ACKOQ5_08640, partial [Solirubrobacterales bacterium]
MRATLASLVDRATGRLRDARKLTRTVTVGVRFADMSRATSRSAADRPVTRASMVGSVSASSPTVVIPMPRSLPEVTRPTPQT